MTKYVHISSSMWGIKMTMGKKSSCLHPIIGIQVDNAETNNHIAVDLFETVIVVENEGKVPEGGEIVHDAHGGVRSAELCIKLAVDAAKDVIFLVQPCCGLDDESFDALEIDGKGKQWDEGVLGLNSG